jgi:Uma2 family endonuclease
MVTRLLTTLSGQLRPPCEAFSSNVRVRIPSTNRERYPDVRVVCGPVVTTPDDPDAITNPTILIEVLSPSTEAADRGAKLDEYRQLATLRAYLLADPDRPHVEVWTRASGDTPWREALVRTGTITLDALGATLVLSEIYAPPASTG